MLNMNSCDRPKCILLRIVLVTYQYTEFFSFSQNWSKSSQVISEELRKHNSHFSLSRVVFLSLISEIFSEPNLILCSMTSFDPEFVLILIGIHFHVNTKLINSLSLLSSRSSFSLLFSLLSPCSSSS